MAYSKTIAVITALALACTTMTGCQKKVENTETATTTDTTTTTATTMPPVDTNMATTGTMGSVSTTTNSMATNSY
jgi:hypothetical protein